MATVTVHCPSCHSDEVYVMVITVPNTSAFSYQDVIPKRSYWMPVIFMMRLSLRLKNTVYLSYGERPVYLLG
ncbi:MULTISPECIES: IS1 family transposase [Photorhabdus]|uniref:IS1 family transposase n=1 Tax=Photorhabdus TaxID=29487 RepID=UPI0008FF9C4D